MKRGQFLWLSPGEWLAIGLLIVLAGLAGTGRLLVFFKGPFSGMEPLKSLYNQYIFAKMGSYVVNLGDLLELLGILVMFWGVKQY